MRTSLVIIAVAATITAPFATAMQVDGVRVYGRVHDVTLADIRQAIAGIGTGRDVSKVEVLSSKLLHVHLRPADLGWIPVSPTKVSLPDGPNYQIVTRIQWEGTTKGIDDPDVLTVIRDADEVFVFPVTTPDKPHRDNRDLRLLAPEGRRKVVHILGNRLSWWQGGYSLIRTRAEPPNIGLVFRRSREEVILFFASGFDSYTGHVKGTLNGQHASGLLDKKPSEQMQEWRRRYAQPELASR